LLDSLLQRESENGRTILLITHDLSHGLEQSDRIAVLNRGRIATVQVSSQITEAEFLELYAHHTRPVQVSSQITEAEFLELYAHHTRRSDKKRRSKNSGAKK